MKIAAPARCLLFACRIAAGLLLAFVWLAIRPACAQLAPELRPQSDPSVIQNQNLERDLGRPREVAPTPVSPREAPTIDNQQETGGPAVEESPRFVLKEILVNGVTVFKSAELEEKLAPWIDREVGQAELNQITEALTQMYKDHGYITSRAYLPSQNIQDGSVTVQVVEGRVKEVQVQGNRYVSDRYIKARISVKPGEVFRLRALETDMLDLSANSLFDSTHATLKPGADYGTSDIVLDIKDHRPYHLMVGEDNFGRKGIGNWRTSYTAWHENLLGLGDSAIASVTLAPHTTAVAAQYTVPLNTRGWAVGGNFGYTFIEGGKTLTRVLIDNEAHFRDITADSSRFSAFTQFPLYRSRESRRWNVVGNLSLNFIDTDTYLDDVSLKRINSDLKKRFPSLQIDKVPIIRTLTSQVQAVEQDRRGRWLVTGAMTNAFTILGGNVSFTRFNVDVTRVQALPWGMIGIFRAEGQMTPNRLPFAEKMQLGGNSSVRGYPEGYLIADKGYMVSAEVRFPLRFLPDKIENNWQGLVFAEHGGLFRENDLYATDSTDGRHGYLFGYGAGIRGQLSKRLTLRLDLAIPASRRDRNQDVRACFSVNSQLF